MLLGFFAEKNNSPSYLKPNALVSALGFSLSVIQRITLSLLLITYFSLYQVAQSEVQKKQLTISYYADGQKHIVYGDRTPQGYRFNAKAKKNLNLATLNWPPYISEDLCNNGWLFQFTVAMLASKGYQVNIHFFPWARSVKLVEQGKMDILFPSYFIEETAPSDYYLGEKRRELLMLSNAFSGGNLSLVQRKGDDINLNNGLLVLKNKIIGVVRGYQNTPEFDAMMDAKVFSVVEAVNELQLVKLLIAKRVDLIIGDPKVFTFSVTLSALTANKKQQLLEGIELVQPALHYNSFYFAVSKKLPQRQQVMDDINIAINQFEKNGEIDRLINARYQCSKTSKE